jgi:type II secretion system protein D
VYIISDPRTNSLILLATDKTMDLLLALVQELDVLPQVLANINIIPLKRADATQTANVLQQLLFGTTTGARTTTTPGGLGGGLGGLGGGGLGGLGTTAGGLGAGAQLPGAPGAVSGAGGTAGAAGLHISVDERTNSIIVAGNPSDLETLYAIISRLDDAEIQLRRNEVYQLRNAQAADVAQAISTFVTNNLSVISTGGQLTNFQEIQRQVIIVPEPITNKLLISATPQYYLDVMRFIQELDAEQPQVVIQVLIAEVALDADEEFGVEIGVQSPVLFQRGVIPLPAFFGPNGVVNYTTPTTGSGGLVQPGVTVNNSVNPQALPGFSFISTAPLGTNPVASPGVVGLQGITDLGLGRVSPTAGVGGFVFSMQSDAFNLLVRALKTQGRIDILSRPQIMTLDNQTASLLIGQNFPVITSTNITSTGLVSNGITYVDVGVSLSVTPKISPDGKVLMRVTPVVSSVAPTTVSIGNGATATAFNTQQLATTVIANDGETVVLGGLLMKRDQKTENKIPWLGDLPGVGVLFRSRFQTKHKDELVVILTPHIIRSALEADRIVAEEGRRMDWILGNVLSIHGTSGMAPLLPPGTPGAATLNLPNAPAPAPRLPGDMEEVPTLPAPTPVPAETPKPADAPAAQSPPPPPPQATSSAPVTPVIATVAPPATANGSAAPASSGKESSRWNLFRRK